MSTENGTKLTLKPPQNLSFRTENETKIDLRTSKHFFQYWKWNKIDIGATSKPRQC